MTEADLAALVPQWQMPLLWQTVCLYVFGASAVLCAATAIWLARKQRSGLPLAYFVAAVLTVNLEPLIARMSSASHAQTGQITAFVSEGRAIPLHVALVYIAYFGFGYFFLVPALQSRALSRRGLWLGFYGFAAVAWLFEAPFIHAGLWDYFGPQSLKPFGLMPVYFAFTNVASSFIGCALLAATLPYLQGASRYAVIFLGPAYTIGGHFAVAWPLYNLRTSDWPAQGADIGATLTVLLCIAAMWLLALAFTPADHGPVQRSGL